MSHPRKPGEMGRAATAEMVISHYAQNTGFPRYPKVGPSCGTFPKLKWCKMNKLF